jgi:hypothetical protein
VIAETKLDPIRPQDTRAFRDPLGGFVTGVTVGTSRAIAAHTCGITHSFALLSLDPPRALRSSVVFEEAAISPRLRAGRRPRTVAQIVHARQYAEPIGQGDDAHSPRLHLIGRSPM